MSDLHAYLKCKGRDRTDVLNALIDHDEPAVSVLDGSNKNENLLDI